MNIGFFLETHHLYHPQFFENNLLLKFPYLFSYYIAQKYNKKKIIIFNCFKKISRDTILKNPIWNENDALIFLSLPDALRRNKLTEKIFYALLKIKIKILMKKNNIDYLISTYHIKGIDNFKIILNKNIVAYVYYFKNNLKKEDININEKLSKFNYIKKIDNQYIINIDYLKNNIEEFLEILEEKQITKIILSSEKVYNFLIKYKTYFQTLAKQDIKIEFYSKEDNLEELFIIIDENIRDLLNNGGLKNFIIEYCLKQITEK